MAVRTQCPRCKQPLSVPNKLAGTYTSCPRCQGRFWVSKDSPLDGSGDDSVGSSSLSTLTLRQVPVATPPVTATQGRTVAPADSTAGSQSPPPLPAAVTGAATLPQIAPRQYFPSVTPLAPSGSVPLPDRSLDDAGDRRSDRPPAAPPQARKVARLVSAEAAQSTLAIAADGQLPHLQLQESDKNANGQGKARSISPLVLIGAWILSVILTVAIVVATSGNGDSSATTQVKRDGMSKIEEQFFGNAARGELLPYQRLLREARQARARSDSKAERQYYRQVLDLLHTETPAGTASRGRLEKGITGSRDHDRELEQLILKVLGD